MGRLRRWLRVFRNVDEEVNDEIDFHLDMLSRQNEAHGMDSARARREAERRFGDVSGIRRATRREAVTGMRERRWSEWFGALRRDVRQAVRMLVRSPSWSSLALCTLALGIGANTAMFAAVNTVLLRELPYAESESLYSLWLDAGVSVSPTQWIDVRERVRTLEDVAAWSRWTFTLTDDGEPEVLSGAIVSHNAFELLGARAALGRTFNADDALPSADAFPWEPGIRGAVLSHGLWQRRWGGDPSIAGRMITLDGRRMPVLGVMSPAFSFPTREAELWRVVPVNEAASRSTGGALRLLGRARDGVPVEAIIADMRAAAASMRETHPGYGERMGLQPAVMPLRDEFVRDVRPALVVLFGAVAFVLLIACANVANLLLARSAVREREMSIRASLGAARSRLVAQVLTESAVLSLIGGVLGLVLALFCMRLMSGLLPAEILPTSGVQPDGRVLVFTLLISTLAGLFFGAVPALRASRPVLQSSLREGGRSGIGRQRVRTLRGLVVGEFALALILVVGAGLALRSFWLLSTQDPGFRAEGVLSMRVAPSDALYRTSEQRRVFWSDVLARTRAIPGVQSVVGVHLLPLGGSNWNPGLHIEGRPVAPGDPLPQVDWRVVTPGFFATMGVPLREGRVFEEQDRAGAAEVAIVNETLARTLFPGTSPLGARVRTGFESESTWVTIVGVVGNTKDMSLAAAARPQFYRPYEQYSLAALTLMIRTTGDPLRVARPVREAIRSVDADVPVADVQPLARVVSDSLAQPRLLLLLLGVFGFLALLLGVIGVFGVLSYVVNLRRPEFGIRLALGATPRDLRAIVLHDALRLSLIGLALGLMGAFASTRLLSAQLYGITATDPATFLAVSLVLCVAAFGAAWVPARRAARAHAVAALAAE